MWTDLTQEQKIGIVEYAKENGAWEASEKFEDMVGMTKLSLYQKLKLVVPESKIKNVKSGGEKKKADPEEVVLGPEEEVFLQRIKDGSVGLEEAGRKIAGIVFEKMLKNPESVKFDSFFKTKLLELKQSEQADRNNQAMTLINGMFNGSLPPKSCPKCGHVLYEEAVIVQAPEGPAMLGNLDD